MRNLLPILLIILLACENKHEVDISKITKEPSVTRLDQLLFEPNSEAPEIRFNKLYTQYPEFMTIFCEQLFQFGRVNKDSFNHSEALHYLVSDPQMQQLYSATKTLNIDSSQAAISKAFKYYQYHFPNEDLPKLYYHMGKFEYVAFSGSDFIGIGLEMCLGSDHPIMDQTGIPEYLQDKLNLESLPIHVMQNHLLSTFEQQQQKNLLDYMVYNGKILYALDAFFPKTKDHIKIGYKEDKIEWCLKNEDQIWSWLLKHELLYNTQSMEFLKYTTDGPNTGGMPPEAPGNIASWIGWQIVRQYMEEFPETTLKELLMAPGLQNGQVILTKSRYKPL